jgi:hypothetical protein
MHCQVEVSSEGGAQVIRATTDLEAGRLLLHWGLEGGKDYKGGWRLPGEAVRPDGTRQYKDRALQTAFRWARRRVHLRLCGSCTGVILVRIHDGHHLHLHGQVSTNEITRLAAAPPDGAPAM